MTGTDWKDLQSAWQTLPEGAVPAIAVVELTRARRLKWWSVAYLACEIIITIAGFAAAIWLLWNGSIISLVLGVATLLFTAAVAGASAWARAQPRVRDEDPVMLAVATAIRRVEFGLRMARGTLWATAAGQAYIAIIALTISLSGLERDNGDGYIAISLSLGWLTIFLAGALIYMQVRSQDLERLKALEASLKAE